MSHQSTDRHYRGDIDGLRAIAVVLVIFFHSGSEFISSGFIGVDLFFVISGYLITGIILTQVQERRFKLADFFSRRLWRIQPALIVVSLVTLLTASMLYVVPDFLVFLKSAKYNSLFLSNQFFAKQSVAYASPQSEYFPLLHTWSLSIEWQWYLFLPLIVLAGKFIMQRAGVSERNSDLLKLLTWGAATVLLAVISLLISHRSPGESYYFLSTRAFEFAAGGCAFLLQKRIKAGRSWILSLLSAVSLATILFISVSNNIIDGYPDLWTLAVVISTSILLFAGHYREKYVAGVLKLSPLTFIGKISYSLYLWHWPVFAISRYAGITLSGRHLAIAVVVIICLSLASYFLVEEPLRRVRTSLKRSITVLVILPAILFSILYSLAIKHDGFPERLGKDYAQRQSTLSEYGIRAGNREQCLDKEQDPEKCLLGDLKGTRTGLMIGDSNSNHFWGFVDEISKNQHVKMSALSQSSCLTLPGIWQYDWWIYKDTTYDKCRESTEHYFQLIRQNHYDFVVIGEVWEMYASGPHLITNSGDQRSDALSKVRMNNALRNALNIIVATGARPVLIKTIFGMPQDYQECINKREILREDFSSSACNALRPRGKEDTYIASLFEQIKADYPSLIIIDPKDVQCQKGMCVSQIDSVPAYRDVGHLTDYASYRFGQMYLHQYGNPFSH
ncbi:putative O-acetyltransferase (plasmid) [Erwinia amylovora LA637]|uniref:acyltransferase family protein n=1 Tax=Erwinia amylovora TaxID=552 RepID=UPI0003D6056C|nr:acyltransferase family protein [Erwinia amylovora]CDK23925.1 putative O-acetyltransferase [Erwinia amylovora LA637]